MWKDRHCALRYGSLWFSGLLYHVMWWLDTNISRNHAACIFGVEMHGEQKVDIYIGRIWGGVGVKGVIMWASRKHTRVSPVQGMNYSPPYTYPSSYPAYIYVQFPYTTHFNPEDWGSMVLWNTGIQPPHYMVQQPRKPKRPSSLL
jgi:hypothetical protein